MLSAADLAELAAHVETQSVRQLRRYLDYGRRVRQGAGLAELDQWVGRILLDREGVYGIEDRALAFGIGACEWLAHRFDRLTAADAEIITLAGPVDRVLLVRLLVAEADPHRQAALASLFAERYGRIWTWVQARAATLAEAAPDEASPGEATLDGVMSDEATPDDREGADGALFERFVRHLEEVAPLPGAGPTAELEREVEAAHEREERLQREVAAVTDRAERAVARMEALQEEVAQLRRTVRDERDNGERLREERSRRIRTERESRDAAAELERLKAEYLKLDARLRETAQGRVGVRAGSVDLGELAKLDPRQILGLPADATAEDLAQARRRFAAAFHSDRAAQLPPWVGSLFDRLLGIVNAACDRSRGG